MEVIKNQEIMISKWDTGELMAYVPHLDIYLLDGRHICKEDMGNRDGTFEFQQKVEKYLRGDDPLTRIKQLEEKVEQLQRCTPMLNPPMVFGGGQTTPREYRFKNWHGTIPPEGTV